MKFVLSKFYSLCLISLALSRLLYIRTLHFSLWGYLNVPTAQQQQNLQELETAIRLECKSIPVKTMAQGAFVGKA